MLQCNLILGQFGDTALRLIPALTLWARAVHDLSAFRAEGFRAFVL